MKVGMISLGCAKNRVDAEGMLALLERAGHVIVGDPRDAEALVVNTCGFIKSAKQESVDAILEMAEHKLGGTCRRLIVTGCLAERYPGELKEEMPEVDAFLGVAEYDRIVEAVGGLHDGERPHGGVYRFFGGGRVLTTKPHSVYLKIADGCDNRCSYCAIPGIRGPFVSRPMDDILEEAAVLAAGGAKELSLIAQDTTRYGTDLYGKAMIRELLGQLSGVNGVEWIRLLYLYADSVDDKLVQTMLETPKVVKYIDMPIQHVDDEILKRMNRRGSGATIRASYKAARDAGFCLRTTVIVGFPGETDAHFSALMSFLRDHPFERLGAFAYSREEDTAAASLRGRVTAKVRKVRHDAVMAQQEDISRALLSKRVGGTERLLIDAVRDKNTYIARSACEAPEVDGVVSLGSETPLEVGMFVNGLITVADAHNLAAEYSEKEA